MARRSNGSIVIRSVVRRCVVPEASAIGPMRARRASRTRSASPPRCRAACPIRCVVSSISRTVADDGRAGCATRASRAGRRGPTGRARARIPFAASRPARRRELSSAPVVSSHMPLAADEQDAERLAQPVEVVAAHVRDVVERVVEVGGLAALAPRVPARRVVVARQAEREREQVGALEREVDRVVGAEADAERGDLLRAAAVGVDPRHDLVEDPRLVAAVLAARAASSGIAGVRPRRRRRRSRRSRASAGPPASRPVERADHAPVARTPRRCRARPGTRAPGGRSGRRRRPSRSRRSRATTARCGGRSPRARQQAGQVRVERVAPGRVVVQVGHLVQRAG